MKCHVVFFATQDSQIERMENLVWFVSQHGWVFRLSLGGISYYEVIWWIFLIIVQNAEWQFSKRLNQLFRFQCFERVILIWVFWICHFVLSVSKWLFQSAQIEMTPLKHSKSDSFITLKLKRLLRNTKIKMIPSKHWNRNGSFESLKSKWLLWNIQTKMTCSKCSFWPHPIR